jgi:His-Xaa-Ser system radical SAM maturase HxsC
MLKLGGNDLELVNFSEGDSSLVIRLSESKILPIPLRSSQAYLARSKDIPAGFKVYFVLQRDLLSSVPPGCPVVILSDAYDYLADGDVVRVVPNRASIRALYRRNSLHNTFLLTERCNNYCLMCSQPPKDTDDSWIVDEVLATIPLIDRSTKELGFSGGEPTLLGNDLIRILNTCKNWLPDTTIHILSNGRRFADNGFASEYAGVQHPDMMVGIPLYSDISNIHDYVVQADGAFDETIRGILNLKRLKQQVEIRVVIHKQTYERLPQLAEFITSNLLFVDHVALMGLEMTGFTKANLEDLWIDPLDYQMQLAKAAKHLAAYKMNVSIYNHQLCLLDQSVWRYTRKSISDWKNQYMPECGGCIKREECGGFFASANLRYSRHIKPFAESTR